MCSNQYASECAISRHAPDALREPAVTIARVRQTVFAVSLVLFPLSILTFWLL